MSANRVVQAIRPHIPLIKFRAGGGIRKVISPVTVPAITGTPPPLPCPISSAKANTDVIPAGAVTTPHPSSTSSLKPPSTRRSDAPEFFQLHPKYHRTILTPEEIDYINRGGPD